MTRYQVRHIIEAIFFIGIIVGGIAAIVAYAYAMNGVPDKIAEYILSRGII